ncbi:hypothetical protein [Bacillus sp. REN10]|uniref:DUF6843 domain-containing protein n=1 Tax=Bacillus sp. REN10 TaxID=2782541 RepID=UPI00193B3E7D|nr:hypothetical protein [Bacillus sp. REN10]
MRKTIPALFFVLFALVGCTNDRVTNDIYLIPEDYEGYVYAFYNVKGAPEIKKEGDYKVYPINDEGYYATSTPDMDYGTVTDQYYYVDKNGKRTKINEECIRGLGTGGFEHNPGSADNINIHYTGIEVTKDRCGQEFMQSGNGMRHEDLDPVLAEVMKKHYGIE